jgi:hypothetical protein
MKALSTGSSDVEKRANWDYINKVLERNGKRKDDKMGKMNEEDFGVRKDIQFSQELMQLKENLSDYFIEKVIKEEPNVSFQLLCFIYKAITRKE